MSALAAELAPLFEIAERDVLWFFARYNSLWFRPDELRAHQARGKFLLQPEMWQLRCPFERLAEIDAEITRKQHEREKFAERIGRPARTTE